jgi:hypothetical protein
MEGMQIVFRGSLREKAAGAYREWLAENLGALQEHAPPGWTYAGTYFTVFGFGKHDVEGRWELANYAALDAAREHTDETWNRLNAESGAYFEPTVSGETSLMRSAEDVRIIE